MNVAALTRALVRMRLVLTALLVTALVAPAATVAQDTGGAPPPTPVEQAAPEGPRVLAQQDQANQRPAPLGADIFQGVAPSYSPQILDPSYILQPGDRVHVSLYGAVTQEMDLSLDARGNIVVPNVGPISLGGVRAGGVQAAVTAGVRKVYNENVRVYASALVAAPIQVLVTGPVARPGAYPAGAGDSVVTLLQRAGGIDPNRGSYRNIRIVRGGQVMAVADLYEFLRAGALPDFSFRNGDAIVVGEQGPVVSVEGTVRAPFTFELEGPTTGSEILMYARPRPETTHAALIGTRDRMPVATYLTIDQFARQPVADGDRVRFERDVRAQTLAIRVEGAHDGPSVFTVQRGATVGQVLAQVQVDPLADQNSIYLRRESVRRTQKAMLEDSLRRLERAALTAPMRTPGEATARTQEAAFITQFVSRARSIEPLGIVTLNGQDRNRVLLEPDDVIVIPEYSQVVTIAGEVQAPQSILHRSTRVSDYIKAAGGFTPKADRGHVLVLRADGGIREDGRVQPGDRILVLPKMDSKIFELVKDFTQILYQIAIAARAVDGL
ncbi:MAG: SLBB domain-containing protein [Caulobacteraceae bacterium]|nr:SLBB domain-containing protein [Caulobacteraceae bacterium]